jgi:serine/threonine protein kinase
MSTNQNFYIFKEPTSNFETFSEFMLGLKEPMTLQVLQNIAFEILQTLQFLHNKGITHLDLQPTNIFIANKEFL